MKRWLTTQQHPQVVTSRRQFLQRGVALAGLALASGCRALPLAGQPPRKIPRVGYLTLSYFRPPLEAAFRQGLSELGYADGQTVTVDVRTADQEEALPALAAELVGLRPDVVVSAAGDVGVQAIQASTSSLPIVCPSFGDPVETGFAVSLAHPGGNATGLSTLSPQLGTKRLDLLKETVPGFARLGALTNPSNRAAIAEWRQAQAAAETMGVHAVRLEVRHPDDLDRAFEAAVTEQVDALLLLVDALIGAQRLRIIDFATTRRIPTMFYTTAHVEDGALMAYGVVHEDLWRRAAGYVDRILKGAKPAEMPIEQATTFEFAVNMKTASALGLTIPPLVLQQTTAIIQ